MDDPWSSNAWGEDAAASTSSASPWTSPVVASSTTPMPASTDAAFDDDGWAGRGPSMEETVEEWSSSSGGWSGAATATVLDDLGSPTLEMRTPRLGDGQDVSEGFEDVSFAAPPSHDPFPPPITSSSTSYTVHDGDEPIAQLSLDEGRDSFPSLPAVTPAEVSNDDDDDAWGTFGSTTLPSATGEADPLPKWSPETTKPTPTPVEESEPTVVDDPDQAPVWSAAQQEEEVAPAKGAEEAWASAAEEGSNRRAALRRVVRSFSSCARSRTDRAIKDPARLAALLVQTRDWASEAFAMPQADDATFLPPGQAAMTMNVLGAMTDADGEM